MTASEELLPAPPATQHRHEPNRLYQVAAWVAIVAGVLFIVGAVFFTGFSLGRGYGAGWGHHGRGGPMGPPMMPMTDGGRGMTGPGGMMDPDDMMGPGMMGPDGMMGPGMTSPGMRPPAGAPPPPPRS